MTQLNRAGKYNVWIEDLQGNQSNFTIITVQPLRERGKIIARTNEQLDELFASKNPFKKILKGKSARIIMKWELK